MSPHPARRMAEAEENFSIFYYFLDQFHAKEVKALENQGLRLFFGVLDKWKKV